MPVLTEEQAAAEQVLARARHLKLRIGTAESCTGGLVAAALTDRPGSSDVFDLGLVTYSNHAKSVLLGVPDRVLERHGAVSAEVAQAMATGLLARHGSIDLAVAITGIAGPGGGSADKPVGLVLFGITRRNGSPLVERHVFAGTRQEIRAASVCVALRLLLELMPE